MSKLHTRFLPLVFAAIKYTESGDTVGGVEGTYLPFVTAQHVMTRA